MTEIRDAKLSDVPKLIPLTKNLFQESGWEDTFGYTTKDNDTMFWLASAIRNPDFGFFLAQNQKGPVGFLIARLNPWSMNFEQVCAFELYFYVDRRHRNGRISKRLVEHYETWAQEKGAKAVEFGLTEKLRGGKMAKFLERRGYEPALRSHVKKLEVSNGS